jgi:hypothetical protein
MIDGKTNRRTKSKNKVILPKIMFFDKTSVKQQQANRDRHVSEDIRSWIDNENAVAAQAASQNISGIRSSKILNQDDKAGRNENVQNAANQSNFSGFVNNNP